MLLQLNNVEFSDFDYSLMDDESQSRKKVVAGTDAEKTIHITVEQQTSQ